MGTLMLAIGGGLGWLARGRRDEGRAQSQVFRWVAPAPRPAPVQLADAGTVRDPAPERVAPTMFRGDRLHTGRSGFRLPERPSVRATFRTEGRITAQPVVAPNGTVVVGSHDGVLYGLDPVSATARFRLQTGDRIYASAVITPDARVYAGSDADRLFSLDASGHLQWALATDDDADTAPAIAPDGSLRFAAGRVLYATETDLTVRWRVRFGGKLFASPTVLDDGTTLIGSQDDRLHAIDPSGVERWSYPTGGDVDATVSVHGDTAYVGSDDGYVHAVSLRDGQRRWRTRVGGYVRAAIAQGLDGTLVVGTFGPRPAIVALSRIDGQERWRIAVPGGPPTAEWGGLSAALVDRDGRYAIGTPSGQVWLIEPDGTVYFRVALREPVDTAPVLTADGELVVGSDDGAVYFLSDPGPLVRNGARDR